ncbi:MAG TPA: hopanoid biosynthesis associated radical SAM protein HpnJ [Candidatus Brocadia sapporoensis]|nr:hopanoid biosynthesis associated radical SAM protein HpnJ [Candidatus Brocadia sp.]HQU31284.1 hopanoid biosynthesis associated radical SAM protein HpnJ [Candidatus Brocadia sapporoensis]
MPPGMKTLLLNPPSFENFDGGAGSRWPATREILSFWYPVWLAYPAGMLPGSRLLDAPPNKTTPAETIEIARDYDFIVLFTSTIGFSSDLCLVRRMKEVNPDLKIAFVGPHVQVQPVESLTASSDVDFVVYGEFDHAVVEFAQGKPLRDIPGISYRQDGRVISNPPRPPLETEELDRLPFVTEVYKRDLVVENYNIPFLMHPYISFYTSRGCPSQCSFCLWPQTFSGRTWRVRSTENVVREVRQALEMFPQVKEFYFDDDTFNIRKDRVLDICSKFKPLKFRWSCNARPHSDYETLKAMADAGVRLFVVGFESGDPQILKNIKKGITIETSRAFVKNCKKVGIKVHGDFIIGLPGETSQTIERTIDFAKELDCETIQVSVAHALPGTEFYDYVAKNKFLISEAAADVQGHQLPHVEYPGLSSENMIAAVNRFYDTYYFRPRVIWRIVRNALWDSHERKRLYGEAVSFLRLRAERLKWARKGFEKDPKVT